MNFRVYVHSMACTAIGHALSFIEGTNDKVADPLMEEAIESAFKLIEDLDIFGDKEQQNQNS